MAAMVTTWTADILAQHPTTKRKCDSSSCGSMLCHYLHTCTQASYINATQAAAFWSQTATVSCTQSVTVWRCPSTKHTTTRTIIKQTSRQALSVAYLFTTSLVKSNYLHLFCQSVFDNVQRLPFITQSFPSVYFNTPALVLCI